MANIIFTLWGVHIEFKFNFPETKDSKYNFSSFEMAMVNSTDDNTSAQRLIPPSHGGSAQASIASSKRTGKSKLVFSYFHIFKCML